MTVIAVKQPSASTIVAGIDEAGRGPLAGPVTAAACVIPCELFRRRRAHWPLWSPHKRTRDDEPLLGDSKTLSEEERERAFAWIIATCPHGIASVSAGEIDAIGILRATERAMREAVIQLASQVTLISLLVDGRDHFSFDFPHRSIIRGDQSEPSIAAASIVAKVTRDRWMREQSTLYPQYGFDGHKGYASDAHREAIRIHGPCPLHRKSFLRNLLNEQLTLLAA